MNDAMASFCIILFLVLAPALLIIKFTAYKPAWWLILVIILFLGWGLVVGTYFFNQMSISDLIAQNKELPEGWDRDGASGLFAVFFGWLLSLVYFLLWLVIYMFATLVRRFFNFAQAPNKHLKSDAARAAPLK